GAPLYVVEQLGFRKVVDTSFMMGSLITGDPDPGDVERYFRALRWAQRDIDVEPELYTHYFLRELPERYHSMVDTRAFGPGERIACTLSPSALLRAPHRGEGGVEAVPGGALGRRALSRVRAPRADAGPPLSLEVEPMSIPTTMQAVVLYEADDMRVESRA